MALSLAVGIVIGLSISPPPFDQVNLSIFRRIRISFARLKDEGDSIKISTATGSNKDEQRIFLEKYGSLLRGQIQERTHDVGGGGLVKVRFVVSHAGIVEQSRITETSGNGHVDDEVLRILRSGEKFARMPSELNVERQSFSVPVLFRGDEPRTASAATQGVELPAPVQGASLPPIAATPAVTAGTSSRSDTVPQFFDRVPHYRQFPAEGIYRGPDAPALLDTRDKAAYRTRLREAARAPINFGGRYTIATWGCGTSCETGAIVDHVTGIAEFLPTTAVGGLSNDDRFERFRFRSDSRLLVVSGGDGDDGPMGMHFYRFEHGKFSKILYLPMPEEMPAWAQVMERVSG